MKIKIIMMIIILYNMSLFAEEFSIENIRIGQSFNKIKNFYSKKIDIYSKGESDCKTCGICKFNLNLEGYNEFRLDVDMKTNKIVAIFAEADADSIQSGLISVLNTYGKADKEECFAKGDGNTIVSCLNSNVDSVYFRWTDEGAYSTDTGNYSDILLGNAYVMISIANRGIFFKSPRIEISVVNSFERFYPSICK